MEAQPLGGGSSVALRAAPRGGLLGGMVVTSSVALPFTGYLVQALPCPTGRSVTTEIPLKGVLLLERQVESVVLRNHRKGLARGTWIPDSPRREPRGQ